MTNDFVAEILLKEHGRRFDAGPPYDEYLKILQARDQVLERFQPELSDPENLSEATFRDFLSFEHNQHWTGLQRPSKHACDDMPKLRRAITILFDENVEVSERLDLLTTDDDVSVPGVAIGILTPLLLIRYPNRYGVWNGKSEAAMKTLKIWPNLPRGTSKGERYRELNACFRDLAERMGIDLWSLDGLWHVINEKSKLETDEAFLQLESEERAYFEGQKIETSGYRFERSSKARNDCIKSQGLDCIVCGFNFFTTYGELGLGYIQVHHREDLAQSSESRTVDPKKDLVPVCPNCHAMLHKGVTKSRTPEELTELIEKVARQKNSDVSNRQDNDQVS